MFAYELAIMMKTKHPSFTPTLEVHVVSFPAHDMVSSIMGNSLGVSGGFPNSLVILCRFRWVWSGTFKRLVVIESQLMLRSHTNLSSSLVFEWTHIWWWYYMLGSFTSLVGDSSHQQWIWSKKNYLWEMDGVDIPPKGHVKCHDILARWIAWWVTKETSFNFYIWVFC